MERITKKLIKAQGDVEFVRLCLIHDLIPKVVRFKSSHKNLTTSLKVKIFQRQLLLSEYLTKQKQVKKLKSELNTMKNENFLNTFDLHYRMKLNNHMRDLEKYKK